MTSRAYLGTVLLSLSIAGASSVSAQQYLLYSPKAVDAEQKSERKEGVLVQEVKVQKGDTLYGLSRRFSGHGEYFSQILIFNELKDPNKIYPGTVLKIPVTRKSQAEAAPQQTPQPLTQIREIAPPSTKGELTATPNILSIYDLKKSDLVGEKKRELKKKAEDGPKKPEAGSKKVVNAEKSTATVVNTGRYPVRKIVSEEPRIARDDPASPQKLFEQAVKAYRVEDYRKALELFDRFLSENPSSALAPDASLYKAECYLKQSAQ